MISSLAGHFDCQRFNVIAAQLMEPIADTLCSLDLTISKYTKNRRGKPGPATFDWIPSLPQLTSLDLEFSWDEIGDWQLSRWAPNLKTLTVLQEYMDCRPLGKTNALPPSLSTLNMMGGMYRIDKALFHPFASLLKSLSLNYPKVGASELFTMKYPPSIHISVLSMRKALKALTELTSLALNIGSLEMPGDANEEEGHEEGPMTTLLGALQSLSRLEELKLAAYAQLSEEQGNPKYFMNLKQVRKLHILGHIPGFLKAAEMAPGTFPNLKEFVRCGGNRERVPGNLFPSGIESITVDYDAVMESPDNYEEVIFPEKVVALRHLTLLPSGVISEWLKNEVVARALIIFINRVLEAVCSAGGEEGNFTLALEEDFCDRVTVLVRTSMNYRHPKVNIEALIDEDDNEVFGEILTWKKWERKWEEEFFKSAEPSSC